MLIKTGLVRLLLHPRRLPRALFVAIIAIITTISLGMAQPAHAAQTIPYKINFQGRLTDASGNTKPDGKYNMRLRLYTAASSGTNVWQADRIYNTSSPTDYRVQVTNGLFSIQLGDVASGVANDPALSPSLFSSGTYLYLEVELPTTGTATCNTSSCQTWTEGPMTPRSPLGSSAYAFNADTVDGIDSASLARNDASNTFGSGVTNTFNGRTVIGNTATVTNNSMLGFNIAGTSGAYTLQNSGTGTYFYSDGSMTRIGMMASDTAGTSINPVDGDNDVIAIASAGAGFATAVNAGVGYGTNLVENGGFEFGTAGWHTGGTIGGFTYTNETANPKDGAVNLKFTKTAGGDGGSIYQRFQSVLPGETYYASAWVKTSSAATGTGGVRIEFFDKTGTSISTTDSTTTNPGTTYTLRTLSVVAPANAVTVLVQPFINTDGSAGSWYFDDMYAYRSDRVDPALFKNAVDSTTAFQIQNANGAALLVADTSGLSLKVGGGDVSPDGTPALLVLDYKNTSGDPTGTNGAMYYNSNSGRFRCYEAGAWADCITKDTPLQSKFRYQNEFTNYANYTTPATINHVDTTLDTFSNQTGSSVTSIASESSHPGIWNLATGSTSSGNAFITSPLDGVGSYYNQYRFGGGNGAFTFAIGLRIPTASGSGQTFNVMVGYNNNVLTPNGCMFRYSDTINSGKWQGYCAIAGTSSVCDTGMTMTAGNWYNLQMTVNAAATQATFTATDGSGSTSSCASPITSNIPTTVTALSNGIYKTAGSTSRTLNVDYIEFSYSNLSR